MPSVPVSLAVAAMAAVLAVASAAGSVALVGGVALIILFFAFGVVAAGGFAAARWSAWLSVAAGGAALTWTHLDRTADLEPMAAVLAPAFVVAIVVQLWRRDGRAGLTSSLSVSVAACVFAVLPVAWIALRDSAGGGSSVGLALLGVGVVGLAEALPISRAARRVVGVLIGAVAAGTVVMTVERIGDSVPAVSGVVVTAFAGLMVAIAFAAVDRIADDLAGLPSVESEPQPVESQPAGRRAGRERVEQHGTGRHPIGGRTHPAAAGPSDAVGDEPPESGPDAAGEAVDGSAREPLVGSGALVPLRVTLPFLAAAPAAFVLGRIFVG